MIAQLGDVGVAGERGRVQRFDVGQPHRELEPFEVDALFTIASNMKQSFGTGRKAERQGHAWFDDAQRRRRSRLRIASLIFHASRLRRSTMFDTARTCANGTPWIRHADMNAAPSMLSTCGLKRSTTAAIDRSLPWTVLTVMPLTAGSWSSPAFGWRVEVHERGLTRQTRDPPA